MDKTRKTDHAIIEKGLKSKDPNERRQAQIAESKVKSQSHDGWLKSARESLLRETRNGKKDNSTDIRDDIQKHKNMGIGATTFGFSYAPGQYEEIFGKKK